MRSTNYPSSCTVPQHVIGSQSNVFSVIFRDTQSWNLSPQTKSSAVTCILGCRLGRRLRWLCLDKWLYCLPRLSFYFLDVKEAERRGALLDWSWIQSGRTHICGTTLDMLTSHGAWSNAHVSAYCVLWQHRSHISMSKPSLSLKNEAYSHWLSLHTRTDSKWYAACYSCVYTWSTSRWSDEAPSQDPIPTSLQQDWCLKSFTILRGRIRQYSIIEGLLCKYIRVQYIP